MDLLNAVAGFGGLLLGHILTRRYETSKQWRALQTAAYVDYLRGVTATTIAQRHGDASDVQKGIALMADAKTRITVYGGPKTLKALGEFSRNGAQINSREAVLEFLAICDAMREESGGKAADIADVSTTLFAMLPRDFPSRAPPER